MCIVKQKMKKNIMTILHLCFGSECTFIPMVMLIFRTITIFCFISMTHLMLQGCNCSPCKLMINKLKPRYERSERIYNQDVQSPEEIEEDFLLNKFLRKYKQQSKILKCEPGKCSRKEDKVPKLVNSMKDKLIEARQKILTKLVKPTMEEMFMKIPLNQMSGEETFGGPETHKMTYCINTTKSPSSTSTQPSSTTTSRSSTTTKKNSARPIKISKVQEQKTLASVKQNKKKLKDIVKKYENVFRGLGCKYGKCHITINQDSGNNGVPSKIIVALQQDLKKELDYMENLGVITKDVEPTSWVVYLPQERNRVKEADNIASKIIHGDADESVLVSLRSDDPDVRIAEASTEQVLIADVPADDAVDGGDLPMYEMESFYRDISLNDHLSWVRPVPTIYLKHRTSTILPTTRRNFLYYYTRVKPTTQKTNKHVKIIVPSSWK